MKASDMKPVSSWEEYKRILSEYKRECPGCKITNYLLPEAAREAIDGGKLFDLRQGDMLMLFVKERRICHIYVQYGAGTAEKLEWDLDMPCILDEPARSAEREASEEIRHKWDALGFAYRATHMRMVWKPEHPEMVHPHVPVHVEYEITEEMIHNWYSYLDTTALSVPDEPRPCVNGERMLTIRDEEGKIACQVYTYPSKKTINAYFLVTVPAHRGKSYAKEIAYAFFEAYYQKDQTDRVQVWVDCANRIGIASDEKVGYRFDNFLSHQYVLCPPEGSVKK